LALGPGSRLGPYEILSALGAGGMGEVYRASDTTLGRQVAIKVLPDAFAQDAERLARFEREAKTLAALNDPHIAQIYGLEQSSGVRALVMELVEGEDLSQRIARGPIPLDEALPIARQIAEALEIAHEQGIVHRDLKPANIKIRPDGVAKVLDFGLAKAAAGIGPAPDLSQSPTVTYADRTEGILLGTVAYMSPEQARGRPVDRRADIWAFGCVLYEMLAGRQAFGGDTLSDAIGAVLHTEPNWHALSEDVPTALRRLLRRCLEKDPKRRLRDVGDARADLDDVLSGAGEPGASAPIQASPRGAAGWTVAGVLAAVLVAVALWGWTRAGSTRSAAPTLSRAVRLTTGAALEFGAAISPDGKWVAHFSNVRGPMDLWVKFVAGGEAVNLTATTTLELPSRVDIGGLAISPDGTSIAFDAGATKGTASNLFDSWVIPAPVGGVPRKMVERGRSLRWSPDGTKIAYVRAGASAGDSLFVADADGTNAREIVPTKGGMHVHWPSWSHDSQYIYFNYSVSTVNSEPAEIYRVPASGGPLEPVVQTSRRAIFPLPVPDGTGVIFAANPFTVDLGLWWKPLANLSEAPRQLTAGLGEYGELSISADGSALVATFLELRQSLVSVPLRPATDGRAALRMLTDEFSGDVDPTFSPQGDRLVFSSSRSGSRNLWTARSDATDARPLTSGSALDELPSFSPDGRQIAFVSDRGGQRGIWAMNADGGAARSLVKAQVLDVPTWSADGREIAYSAPVGATPGLWVVSVDSGATRQLPTPGAGTRPAWSPRGDVIAYIEATPGKPDGPNTSRVAFVDRTGQPVQTSVPTSPNVLNGFLAWSSDGRYLAAITEPGATTDVIWIVDVEKRTPFQRLVELPPGIRVRGAAWSSDGSSIVLGQRRGSSDIVRFDVAP